MIGTVMEAMILLESSQQILVKWKRQENLMRFDFSGSLLL